MAVSLPEKLGDNTADTATRTHISRCDAGVRLPLEFHSTEGAVGEQVAPK